MRSIVALSLLVASAILPACSGGGESVPAPDPWPIDAATGLRVPELGPVPALPDWKDNPPTAAKKELGRALFSDARLSGSGKTVCGNCHFPAVEFQSGGPKDAPDRSYPAITPTLPRNTPSLLNVVYAPIMRWDGAHFTDLVDMMVLPLAEANMNLAPGHPASEVEIVDVPGAQAALKDRLTTQIPGYVPIFQGAFGQDIKGLSPQEIWRLAGEALAVYIRVAVSRDAPFDRWNKGDDSAMGEDAVRGLALFRGRAACGGCHSGPFFTDFAFHNIGTSPPGPDGKRPDEGRYLVTHEEADRGAFLTPTLRSSSHTSPYLHDGSEVSISKVLARKTSAATRALDPNHDGLLDKVPELTEAEVADLVAFIKALKGAELPLEDLAAPVKLP